MFTGLLAFFFFFFNDTATTEIYTLSLHDALPICARRTALVVAAAVVVAAVQRRPELAAEMRRPRGTSSCWSTSRQARKRNSIALDRKSTRLNSSHSQISYAVFCLKKTK